MTTQSPVTGDGESVDVARTVPGAWVNDVHSQLNRTWVRQVVAIRNAHEVPVALELARRSGLAVSIAGGRHAMGGQQFGWDTLLLDMRGLGRVGRLNAEAGTVEVEAGTMWPEIVASLVEAQQGRDSCWGIAQKQTGADRLTVGGALAANVHGRGLRMKPFAQDIESFVLVDAEGRPRRCSREENVPLFRLAVGGYGLFGVVTSVTLRLAPRQKLERVVRVMVAEELMDAFEARIAAGFLYGDFQFAIDPTSDDFLRRGVFSCYRPVDPATPMPRGQRELSPEQWRSLLRFAHSDPRRAFEEYATHYLATSGQIYWSDTHQLATYLDDYHSWLDGVLRSAAPATEMITEVYVPRGSLAGFLAEARGLLRRTTAPLIYGTIRLTLADDETFLAWAREPYACVVFNLHTAHTPEGREASAWAFRGLVDLAIAHRGSYYLTYHRHARRDQLLACYPQLPEFLRQKRRYDPEDLFQSDWYRHHRAMIEDG